MPHDISKLNAENFPEGKDLTKDDYVIIAGDFGLIWNHKETGLAVESNPDDRCWTKEELYWQKWLDEKPWTTLFIDGNHENYDRLESYPVSEWNGGRVHMISQSMIHLMRGQIFRIADMDIFTFGGARSTERGEAVGMEKQDQGRIWWRREMPSEKEMDDALKRLAENSNEVDYIITHSLPTLMLQEFRLNRTDKLTGYFDKYVDRIDFKRWYSGHYHMDMRISKYVAIYKRVVELG